MKKTVLLAVLLFVCFLLSCCLGRYYLSPNDILNILAGNAQSAMDANVFLNIRLPRTIIVMISGGALALSGFVYQSLFRNPLVSPDVMGVSSGASVGAIIAILFFGSSTLALNSLSFAFGILIVVLSMLLSKVMGGKRLYTMVLSGIIMSSLATSVIMTLKYMSDPNKHLAAIEYWLMGSFNTALWSDLKILFPLCLIALVILYLLRQHIMALALGDDEAQSLGISVNFISAVSIICSTVIVSSVVSIAGVVSWIGLIVPHMARIWGGDNYIRNFTQSIFLGGILLLLADTIARTVTSAEIPISILTSLMGAISLMVFLYWKNRR